MTEPDPDWDDADRVNRWVARDAGRTALQTARELTVAVIALDTRPATVLELAGGAGTFLATFLDAFPDARGVWSDSSREMQRHARATLSGFGERVDYLLADMRSPGAARGSADVVVCARATHGLRCDELGAFYREVAGILRPGGWLVNLDHMAVPDPWGARYDQLTARFYDEAQTCAPVRKTRGSHPLEVHLDALREAGLTEADTPWRLLATVLLLARRPPAPGRPMCP